MARRGDEREDDDGHTEETITRGERGTITRAARISQAAINGDRTRARESRNTFGGDCLFDLSSRKKTSVACMRAEHPSARSARISERNASSIYATLLFTPVIDQQSRAPFPPPVHSRTWCPRARDPR